MYESGGSVGGGSHRGGGIAGHSAGSFDHSGDRHQHSGRNDRYFEHSRQAGQEESA
nr:MAG TPA: hypothetical protein [Caudoviricetes sp.]